MGAGELSPPYVIRIFRQFGFTDQEIDELLANRWIGIDQNTQATELKEISSMPLTPNALK